MAGNGFGGSSFDSTKDAGLCLALFAKRETFFKNVTIGDYALTFSN